MIEVSIDVPKADIDALEQTFTRYAKHFNLSIPKAIEKTAVKIITALRARTVRSKEHRRIVRNPLRRSWDKMMRRHEHIQQYYREHPETRHTSRQGDQLNKGLRTLKELRKVGQAPYPYAIEYFSRRGMRFWSIPNYNIPSMAAAKQWAAVNLTERYKIKRRGLARSSWAWMMKQLGKQATAEQTEVNGAVEVRKFALGAGDGITYVEMRDMLRYIRKATSKGDVTTAISSANKMLEHEIKRDIERAAQASGVRAA